jgi:beta-lactamase class C
MALSSPTPDPTHTNNHHLIKALQMLEEMACDTVKAEEAPGLAVGVFDSHNILYAKGFGVTRKEFPSPITPSTLFQMASVSKPICATALAILQYKGLCSLKEHPHKYLPNLFSGDACKDLIIEHLLNHSSGITYEGFEELIESYVPRKHILKKLEETRPCSMPGETFEYNNVVYGLIEDIMSVMTHKTLDNILQEYLFRPLQMEQACVGLPALLEASNRFFPYMEDDKGELMAAPHYSHSYYIFPASAGVNASINDLISFIQLYLGKYPDIIQKEALSPLITPTINANKSLEFLGMPREPIQEAWYGLGWLIMNLGGEKVVFHTGYLNGVRNFVGFMPNKGIGIVLLANSERKVASKLGLEFFYQVLGK